MLGNIYKICSRLSDSRVLATAIVCSIVTSCGQGVERFSSRTSRIKPAGHIARDVNGQDQNATLPKESLLLTKISENLDSMSVNKVDKSTVLATIVAVSATKFSTYLNSTNILPETGFCLVVPISGDVSSFSNPAFEVSPAGTSIHLKAEVKTGSNCSQAILAKLSEPEKKIIGLDGLDFLVSFVPKM